MEEELKRHKSQIAQQATVDKNQKPEPKEEIGELHESGSVIR